jgi:protein SCO1/2
MLACLLGLGLSAGFAQVSSYGEKQVGDRSDELPKVLKKVGVAQHLNQSLPLNAEFLDETGKTVKLGDYFGKKPALLSLVYFSCPMLCSEELDGMTSALEMVKMNPGTDFNVVIVSIDPTDTPEMAAKKKAFYLKRYGRPETAAGWHYLTGKTPAIDAVTDAVGFGYVKVPGPDGQLTQFAHASSLEVVTTDGKLAQYYLGVEYSPKDVMLGLIDASNHKIGSPVANILTYCYHYDPETNKHSLIVARVVQLGGMLTVAGLGGFMILMFRKDIQLGREHEAHADDLGQDPGAGFGTMSASGSAKRNRASEKSNGDKG